VKRWILLCAVLPLAVSAGATTILTFGQTGGGSPITATNSAGTTTISAINVPITVTQIDAGVVTPLSAFFNLTEHSVSPATAVSGNIVQSFSGSFSITSLAGGGGTNFLSGTFTDFVFGALGGASLTLSASEPPGTVSFTSGVISASGLNLARAISLSFANVTPAVNITGASLGSFTSSVSGTFSANVPPVPEPSALVFASSALLLFSLRMRKR